MDEDEYDYWRVTNINHPFTEETLDTYLPWLLMLTHNAHYKNKKSFDDFFIWGDKQKQSDADIEMRIKTFFEARRYAARYAAKKAKRKPK